MAYEEAMKYGAKVILGDRPVQVSYFSSVHATMSKNENSVTWDI